MWGLEELRAVHSRMGLDEARKLKAFAQAVAEFDAAADKAAAAASLRVRLAAAGVNQGLSLKSFYKHAQRMREGVRLYGPGGGILALRDGRGVRKAAPPGLPQGAAFRAHWEKLCVDNRRAVAPAYRALLDELASGAEVPGCGTWRDVWAREHGGVTPPEGMTCPWSGVTMRHPKGWSERNLKRIQPDAYALLAARIGPSEAYIAHMPTVKRTRVGLRCCEVVEVDDFWHWQKVTWGGNKFAQRVVELNLHDDLTGYIFGNLWKPVEESESEGQLKTLKLDYMRYLMAYLLCEVGVSERGVLLLAEGGTAAVPPDLLAACREVCPNFQVLTGGRHADTLAKGDYNLTKKGNPRSKARLEGIHALVKNELAHLEGTVGGGRGRNPEWASGMEEEHNRLYKAAAAINPANPAAVMGQLMLPHLPYRTFSEEVHKAYNRINNRQWHNLEGWEACGFMVPEWRPSATGPNANWLPMDMLKELDKANTRGFIDVIMNDPKLFRYRKMSPREAWEARAAERKPAGDAFQPLILGEKLARRLKAGANLELRFTDAVSRAEVKAAGVLADGRTLTRGAEYTVWYNPLTPDRVFVGDARGAYLGTAAVMEACAATDRAGGGGTRAADSGAQGAQRAGAVGVRSGGGGARGRRGGGGVGGEARRARGDGGPHAGGGGRSTGRFTRAFRRRPRSARRCRRWRTRAR